MNSDGESYFGSRVSRRKTRIGNYGDEEVGGPNLFAAMLLDAGAERHLCPAAFVYPRIEAKLLQTGEEPFGQIFVCRPPSRVADEDAADRKTRLPHGFPTTRSVRRGYSVGVATRNPSGLRTSTAAPRSDSTKAWYIAGSRLTAWRKTAAMWIAVRSVS
jgi:hypothetical protein